MKHLTLSPDLKLPLDVAGEAVALLAVRSAGKRRGYCCLVW